MTQRIHHLASRPAGVPQVCGISDASVRLARASTVVDAATLTEEERALRLLQEEEARHDLFRRLFLRTSARYLRGELDDASS
ncbi:hypothetical protein [Halomonas ramblicola]|uniref:hypothetical protein n=1 Tax=Halomonas ramblicola TaxID=747349 RepID=UPI0025B57A37|nr:hypothetical protein [Halomonas ramblicola]MDN3523095.1 hypothetical protein [Halomonas ramblicola]